MPGWLIRIAHPEDQARLKELLISALKSESARFSTECRLLHKDGYVVHVMMESMPPDHEFEGLRGQIIDISDRVVLGEGRNFMMKMSGFWAPSPRNWPTKSAIR